LKHALVIVTFASLVAGCSAFSPRTAPDSASVAPTVAAHAGTTAATDTTASDKEADAAATDPSLPAVKLTQELMFKLLAAEIAFQRGQWESAYVTTLAAAQQTRDPRLARRAAEMALSAKQGNEALSAVRLWHELAPQSEEATQYLLGLIVLGDDIEPARPILTQRLKDARPATRGLMLLQMQRMLSRAKDKAAAFKLIESLAAPYGTLAEAHVALAQGAAANGDSARARMEARAALGLKPDSELAALTLVQVTPDKNEAIATLEKFLAAYPKARDVRIAYTRILVDQKQYDKARQQFETILKAQPDDLTSLFALGLLSTQINDLKSAETYLTKYLDVLSKHPDEERDPTQALLVLAQIAEERKDSEAALKWLAQIDSGEIYLGAQLKRAQIIAKRGDLPGARAVLAGLKPESEREQVQVIVADAQLMREAGDVDGAMSLLQKNLKRFPDNTELLYDYAMAAEKSNKIEVMETTLRKVIELAPDSQHAYNALGYSLAERNIRLPEAQALIEKALKLAPEDPFIMDSMGWVLFRLGKLKDAEDILRRAYDLRPDPEIATHLGEVLWVKGQKDAAHTLWRDASNKDPQNDTLKSTLSRLHVTLK
jgi:tetratricopeptide (TPR) repeat protein